MTADHHSVLFVYGTLKRGFRNHWRLGFSEFLQSAWTEPYYRMYHCGLYPGLVFEREGEAIHGELYRVSAETLADLDDYEDVPVEFKRVRIRVGAPFRVEGYLYRGDIRQLPSCGPVWTATLSLGGLRLKLSESVQERPCLKSRVFRRGT